MRLNRAEFDRVRRAGPRTAQRAGPHHAAHAGDDCGLSQHGPRRPHAAQSVLHRHRRGRLRAGEARQPGDDRDRRLGGGRHAGRRHVPGVLDAIAGPPARSGAGLHGLVRAADALLAAGGRCLPDPIAAAAGGDRAASGRKDDVGPRGGSHLHFPRSAHAAGRDPDHHRDAAG